MKQEDPTETLRQGIRACREGRWRQGLRLLTPLAQQEERYGKLPGLFYSYLGHAIARCEGRKHVGIELCRHAVSVEPFRPENHLNLAHLCLMVGNRRAAVRSLKTGLLLDPNHAGLLELHRKLGIRRTPPVRWLPREHMVNHLLGRLSWWLRRQWLQLRRAQRRLRNDDEDLWDLDT